MLPLGDFDLRQGVGGEWPRETLPLVLSVRGRDGDCATGGSLRCEGVVVVGEDAGEVPGAVFVEPEVDEVGLARGGGAAVFEEAMGAPLDGAETLHGVDAEGAGGELAGDVAADVLADGVSEGGAAEREAALVVVELDDLGYGVEKAGRLQVL